MNAYQNGVPMPPKKTADKKAPARKTSQKRSNKRKTEDIAMGIRRRVFEHSMRNNGGYLSQACSAAEQLAWLYNDQLKIRRPNTPNGFRNLSAVSHQPKTKPITPALGTTDQPSRSMTACSLPRHIMPWLPMQHSSKSAAWRQKASRCSTKTAHP